MEWLLEYVRQIVHGLEMLRLVNVSLHDNKHVHVCTCRYDYTVCTFTVVYSADVMCEELLAPVNGMIMLMGRTPGSIAMYSCDMGFRLNGEITRTCQTDGNWSDEEPTCICKHASILLYNYPITIHPNSF